jgi:pSer/pThr/pTyr-binding forkhead associated (FHA) protein
MCEIRILDLKLSRKHCLFEFQGKEWVVEDLGSTNGAKLNGQTLANTRSLTSGSVIEAGTTTLTVSGFVNPEKDEDESASAAAAIPEQMPLPNSDEAPMADSTLIASEWEPHADEALASTGALQPRGKAASPAKTPAPAAPTPTPALGLDEDKSGNSTIAPSAQGALTAPLSPRSVPTPSPVAVETAKPMIEAPPSAPARPGRIKPVTIRIGKVDGDDQHPSTPEPAQSVPETVATEVAPAAQGASPKVEGPVRPVVIQSTSAPSTSPGTDVQERTFYITVLGKRIGPLTRTDARDLKARELKGVLSIKDLDEYPQA